jgi:hypothetical protein
MSQANSPNASCQANPDQPDAIVRVPMNLDTRISSLLISRERGKFEGGRNRATEESTMSP